MFSGTSLLTPAIAAAILLAAPTLAQAPTATPAGGVASGPGAAMTEAPKSINEASLVDALLPEASITSLSPAQESKLAADASAYFEAYTASHPISKLEADAFINQLIGGNSDPTPQQSSYILGLLAEVQTGVPANPTAYVASLESAISPFAFAGAVSSYAEDLVQGLRTVVASDLSLPVPTQSSHNAAGPARSVPTGIVGVAAAAAAGAIGAALV